MSDRPTPEQIAEWSRLCNAATPGPWANDLAIDESLWDRPDSNAAFIAAARTAVPVLLAEVALLTKERDEAIVKALDLDARCCELATEMDNRVQHAVDHAVYAANSSGHEPVVPPEPGEWVQDGAWGWARWWVPGLVQAASVRKGWPQWTAYARGRVLDMGDVQDDADGARRRALCDRAIDEYRAKCAGINDDITMASVWKLLSFLIEGGTIRTSELFGTALVQLGWTRIHEAVDSEGEGPWHEITAAGRAAWERRKSA